MDTRNAMRLTALALGFVCAACGSTPPPTASAPVVVPEAAPASPSPPGASGWRPRDPPTRRPAASPLRARLENCSAPADTNGTDKAAARELFRSGMQAFESGDFLAAAEAFTKAYERVCLPQVLYNLATSLERAGNPGDAADVFELFLELQPDSPRANEVRRQIENLRGGR